MRTRFQPHRLVQTALLGSLLALVAWRPVVATDARAAIQAAYDKADEAAELMYPNGVTSVFSADYKVEMPDGGVLPLRAIHRQWVDALTHATMVRAATHITTFVQNDARHATCRVQQAVLIVRTNAATWQTENVVTQDECEDRWVRSSEGWKEAHSKVLHEVVTHPDAAPNLKTARHG